MKIIKQSWDFVVVPDGEAMLEVIESAGRTCYKSEDKITPGSARAFCQRMIKSGHHSVIEHQSVTVRIITDRGVTHEIVRHRLASYSQESTRYCNYTQEKFGSQITVILPVCFYDVDIEAPEASWPTEYQIWHRAMDDCERRYFVLCRIGLTPQMARSVLPNSLKTEIVMTCNIREWRHFFTLRCSEAAHPQMRDLALSMLKGFKAHVPILFDDIYPEMAVL